MQKTTVYLPTELREGLKDVARREGKSHADIIRAALQQYIERSERPWPSSIGMGADGELGAENARAWVREQWNRRLDDA